MSIRVCERWSVRRRIRVAEDSIGRLQEGEVSDRAIDELETAVGQAEEELRALERKP